MSSEGDEVEVGCLGRDLATDKQFGKDTDRRGGTHLVLVSGDRAGAMIVADEASSGGDRQVHTEPLVAALGGSPRSDRFDVLDEVLRHEACHRRDGVKSCSKLTVVQKPVLQYMLTETAGTKGQIVLTFQKVVS